MANSQEAKGSETDIMLARLETKIDGLAKKVEELNGKLYGNGKPGIIVDQAMQDEQIKQLIKTAETNAASIRALQEISTPKWLGKNWRTLATILFVCFVVLHSILPADVSIWTLVSKFLGGG